MIISSDQELDDVMSVLWAKDYKVIPIQNYYKGVYENSIISYLPSADNSELKTEVSFLMKHFKLENVIVKYLNETDAKRISNNGNIKPLDISMYNNDFENKSYLLNGISFSFLEKKQYWKPKTKDDLKVDMVVEYNNKGKWYSKIVKNPSDDYDRFLKLFIKHEKVRVAI
jgi:hypothetical protein